LGGARGERATTTKVKGEGRNPWGETSNRTGGKGTQGAQKKRLLDGKGTVILQKNFERAPNRGAEGK